MDSPESPRINARSFRAIIAIAIAIVVLYIAGSFAAPRTVPRLRVLPAPGIDGAYLSDPDVAADAGGVYYKAGLFWKWHAWPCSNDPAQSNKPGCNK